MSWIDIGPVGMVDEAEVAAAEALGMPFAIFCKDGRVFALHDLCTHGRLVYRRDLSKMAASNARCTRAFSISRQASLSKRP